MAPLLFDPGDPLGVWDRRRLVRAKWSKPCGSAALAMCCASACLAPIGMTDTGFAMNASMRERRAVIHKRDADGGLTPMPEFEWPAEPEVEMGGHGLYSTRGRLHEIHPHVARPRRVRRAERPRVEKKETVAQAVPKQSSARLRTA